MTIRWRCQSVVLAVLVTFIFFFVLQNGRLRGVPINPEHGSPGGTPAEAQFDEKMEEEFNNALEIFYGEVQK
jgi:hypothetical protein